MLAAKRGESQQCAAGPRYYLSCFAGSIGVLKHNQTVQLWLQCAACHRQGGIGSQGWVPLGTRERVDKQAHVALLLEVTRLHKCSTEAASEVQRRSHLRMAALDSRELDMRDSVWRSITRVQQQQHQCKRRSDRPRPQVALARGSSGTKCGALEWVQRG